MAQPKKRGPKTASVLTLAQQWKSMLGCPGSSNKAALAITLGRSRARITQVMSVLKAPTDVLEAIDWVEGRG